MNVSNYSAILVTSLVTCLTTRSK